MLTTALLPFLAVLAPLARAAPPQPINHLKKRGVNLGFPYGQEKIRGVNLGGVSLTPTSTCDAPTMIRLTSLVACPGTVDQ